MSDNPSVILLAEDDEIQAMVILRLLDRCTMVTDSRHVRDGEAALDYLFRRGRCADPKESPRPRIILLDLRMPKIDGLDVLKVIKESESLRDIPVIVLTTSDAEKDVIAAYGCHANSYLLKTSDFQQFSRLLEDTTSYWLSASRLPAPAEARHARESAVTG